MGYCPQTNDWTRRVMYGKQFSKELKVMEADVSDSDGVPSKQAMKHSFRLLPSFPDMFTQEQSHVYNYLIQTDYLIQLVQSFTQAQQEKQNKTCMQLVIINQM